MKTAAAGLALLLLSACGGGASGTGTTDGVDTMAPAPLVLQYIRADAASRLVLEVDAVARFKPRSGTASALEGRLDAILDKPGGVAVMVDGAIASRGSDHG